MPTKLNKNQIKGGNLIIARYLKLQSRPGEYDTEYFYFGQWCLADELPFHKSFDVLIPIAYDFRHKFNSYDKKRIEKHKKICENFQYALFHMSLDNCFLMLSWEMNYYLREPVDYGDLIPTEQKL